MKAIRTIALAGVSLLGFAQTAFAQDTAPVDASTTSDIVVEARRRDESVQDVPLVVNAVTAESINRLNLRDFKDIQAVVPGLTMNSNSNGIGTTSSVRGVNFDVNASGSNGTIEYYLNDAPLTSGALFNAMYDIGQIEVLRGPQGTLRGRAAPSGSITIAHRKPDLTQAGGYFQGTANTVGGINVNAALNVPVIEDRLAIRVAGLVEEGEGNRVHSINAPGIEPMTRNRSGRVFVRAEPIDAISLEGVYQRIEQRSRQFDQVACFNQFSTAGAACPVQIDPEDRLGIKPLPQTTKANYDIFTWKASAGLFGQRLFYVGSSVHQKINVFAPQDEANAYPALNLGQFTTNDSRIKSHEVRLQNEERVAGMFDYVVGYFRTNASTPSYLITERLQPVAGVVSLIPSATLRGSKTSEESYFGNLTLHLGEATELSGGARHIKIRQQSSLGSVSVPGLTAPQPIQQDVSGIVKSGTLINLAFGGVDRTFEKTIFAASAKHRFNDNLMVYANFGTSFRPGNNVVRSTVNARASALETGFLVLPSETSKSYEIGVKSDLLGDTLKLNLAAFQQDYKNYPFRSPSGVFYINYATATSAPAVASFNFVSPVPVRVRGFEFEADWRPTERLRLNLNLAYALGKIKNGQVACLDLNGDGTPDSVTSAPSATALLAAVGANNLSTCPVNFRSMTSSPWNANVQAEYSHPVASGIDVFARGLYTFSGSSLNDPANAFDDYDSYGRLNLYAGIRNEDSSWELTLYGKNLFNNKTILATSNGPAFTAVTGGATINSPYISLGNPSTPGLVAPREFGVNLRVAFGSR